MLESFEAIESPAVFWGFGKLTRHVLAFCGLFCHIPYHQSHTESMP